LADFLAALSGKAVVALLERVFPFFLGAGFPLIFWSMTFSFGKLELLEEEMLFLWGWKQWPQRGRRFLPLFHELLPPRGRIYEVASRF